MDTQTPEAQIDVQAIKAALEAEAEQQRAHEHDASTSAAREENGGSDAIGGMYRAIAAAHGRKAELREQAAALLDAYEAKVRENAELKQELVDSEGYRQHCAEEHAAEVARLTAALAEARRERDEARAKC
jgi:predicted RNase H-like nuclease (RuvC/YqgF family)